MDDKTTTIFDDGVRPAPVDTGYTVRDIVRKLEQTAGRMSKKSDFRETVGLAISAIVQLVNENDALRRQIVAQRQVQ